MRAASAAAPSALDLAQPSLSRQIALLEADLGQRLPARTGRGGRRRKRAQALLVHARAMLDISVARATNCGTWTKAPAGASWSACRRGWRSDLSTPLIQQFRERFPRAVITVLEGLSVSLRESLIAGQLDLACSSIPQSRPSSRTSR